MFILILLLLFICALYASYFFWPNRSLWWLLEWKNRQHYRVHLEGVDYRLDQPAAVIIADPTLEIASLLKRVTDLPVYWVTNHTVESAMQNRLLQKIGIRLVKAKADIPLSEPGIMLMSSTDAITVLPLSMPIWLAYVCGKAAGARPDSRMRWTPRDLQLSLSPYLNKDSAISVALQHLSVAAWERYVDKLPGIAEAWLDQAKALGNRLSVADSTGVKLTHHRLITAVLALRAKLYSRLAGEQRVGVCLPPSVGAVSSLLALLCLGKTIVSLNYTASPTALKAAILEVGLKRIITSRRFLEKLEKKGFAITDILAEAEVILLEDVRKEITQQELLKYFIWVKIVPVAILKSIFINPVSNNQVAAILFSSGSESKPKGVELTQRNIVGNAKQTAEMVEAQSGDVVLGILPIFHAFGLTETTLLPLMEGATLVCHPDPTDTAAIGELAQQYKATILCGTSTFLRFYSRAANITPDMFASLRLVVAGAERLSPDVRVLFEEKFKKVVFEAYGTTELSPASHANLPDTEQEIRHKKGTVGKAFPGCMVRILDPETGEDLPCGEAGLIVIGGVNVMKSYLNDPHKTDQVIMYQQGIRWYKTGDKGRLDEQGFLTVLDRYSRFAKLGGEMVSLGAVETQINLLLGNEAIEILTLAIPDAKKGEKVILLYTGPISNDDLAQIVQQSEMHNLMKPAQFFQVEAIPKLGSGKTDFAAGKALALKLTHPEAYSAK